MISDQRESSSILLDRRITSFTVLSLLLLLVYWNSFHTDWQLDDQFNITENPGLQIKDIGLKSLWGTFFANQGKETPAFFRPLPCLSFALNWYVGKDDPFGYHVVNLACHIITAWIVYVLMLRLLMISKSKSQQETIKFENLAMLATVLWAINPIQTQAVTYIVQRMAIMASFFYLFGMLSYIWAREAKSVQRKWAFAILCFLCFWAGIGSKENVILMPLALVMVEWIFFQNGRFAFLAKTNFLMIGAITLVVVLFIIHLTIGLPFDYMIEGYKDRPFTMAERVLTQPRIVLGYLTQIFLPLPERLSVAHDVILSSSLFHPWTTCPAIVIIFGAIVFSIRYASRFPLPAFAVLFYFLNHAVESSFLPLELVFEHRNYLPSVFLFLPVAFGFFWVLKKLPRFGFAYTVWLGILLIIIITWGVSTLARNKAWETPETLWRDALLKAPNNNRPFVFLGIELAWRENPSPENYRHALVLFKHSLSLSTHRNNEQAKILGNMAWVYFFQGDDAKAVETFQNAIDIEPDFHKNRFDMIKPLIMLGRFEEAKQQADFLIKKYPYNPQYWHILGFILAWQNKFQEASICFQTAMKYDSTNSGLFLSLGVALTRSGHPEQGRWFLKQAVQTHGSDSVIPFFAIIENRIRAGDVNSAKNHARKLIMEVPSTIIINNLNLLPNYHHIPLDPELIRPVIFNVMEDMLRGKAKEGA